MKQSQLSEFKRAYSSSTNDDLGERFTMSLSVVRRLAVQHGLSKDKRAFPGTQKMPRWTSDDVQHLFDYYEDESNLELAKALGRSVKSIVAKAHMMGLKKSKARLQQMGVDNVAKRGRRP